MGCSHVCHRDRHQARKSRVESWSSTPLVTRALPNWTVATAAYEPCVLHWQRLQAATIRWVDQFLWGRRMSQIRSLPHQQDHGGSGTTCSLKTHPEEAKYLRGMHSAQCRVHRMAQATTTASFCRQPRLQNGSRQTACKRSSMKIGCNSSCE